MDILKLSLADLEELEGELSDEELDSLREAIEEKERQQVETLQNFATMIAEKRAEAISYRVSSGIEDEWTEDEEYYEGIDDTNRSESGAWNSKPPGREFAGDDDGTGSTIFLNITRPYCDAAGASLADMLLPTDEQAWQLTNTPVPELLPIAEGEIPTQVKQGIQQDVGGDPEMAQKVEQNMINQAMQMLDEAKEKADKAQKRIRDWHVESQYPREVRKVIEDAARIGSGVLKGPIPQKRRQVAYMDGGLVINEEIKPGSKWISYRNLYPAKGCGENIHDGSYIFERDDISSKKLRELIGLPGYLEEEIKAVLDEGPTEATVTMKDVDEMKRDTSSLFEIWYYHGEVTKEELETVFSISDYESDEIQDDIVHAQITMVNNRVIRAVMNPLDTGEFPYDVMVWQQRKGLPWGIGVSRQIRTPQRMINGAARNLMDNAGLAGGPMWAFNREILTPIDGVAELAPRKGWELDGDSNIDDINKAFTYFTIDMMVQPLQEIIYLGLKMAEDVTGLPMIMQGQMGNQNIETLGQTQILNNNANIVRRRIARLFDDLVTEPHIRRYYTYLLQYGEDDEKGEFVIDARGSSNLVERAIQKEQTMELIQMSKDPVYGIDPKKAAKEWLRSQNFDPGNFEFDDQEWQKVVEQMMQPQPDPRAEIAQIQAQIAQMKEQAHTQRTQMELQAKAQLSQSELQAKSALQSHALSVEVALKEFAGNLEKELAEMKYLGESAINKDTLKVRINETLQKLLVQQQLAGLKTNAAPQVANPAVEPVGRASTGRAFQE